LHAGVPRRQPRDAHRTAAILHRGGASIAISDACPCQGRRGDPEVAAEARTADAGAIASSSLPSAAGPRPRAGQAGVVGAGDCTHRPVNAVGRVRAREQRNAARSPGARIAGRCRRHARIVILASATSGTPARDPAKTARPRPRRARALSRHGRPGRRRRNRSPGGGGAQRHGGAAAAAGAAVVPPRRIRLGTPAPDLFRRAGADGTAPSASEPGVIFLRADASGRRREISSRPRARSSCARGREQCLRSGSATTSSPTRSGARSTCSSVAGIDWITGPELRFKRGQPKRACFTSPRFYLARTNRRAAPQRSALPAPTATRRATRATAPAPPARRLVVRLGELEVDRARWSAPATTRRCTSWAADRVLAVDRVSPSGERKSGIPHPGARLVGACAAFEVAQPYYFNLVPN